MKKVGKIGLFVGFIIILLIIATVFAAKPINSSRGHADIRKVSETGSLRYNLRVLDENFSTRGSFTLNLNGLEYKGSIQQTSIDNTDVFFAGQIDNSNQWLYIAARDNGKINDYVWVKISNQTSAINNVLSKSFPGEGWVVEKGDIVVK